MGYELVYSYHERGEDGDYDKSKLLTLKKRLGNAEEEVPHEKLAATIMAQMSRRDIWVIDVEIFEFTKKKLSFKETKGGLLIGNKKYNLDDCGHLAVQEVMDVPPPQPVPHVSAVPAMLPAVMRPTLANIPESAIKSGGNLADFELLKQRPIRYEVFQPDPIFIDIRKAKSMAFTIGEKYPIYSEKAAGSNINLGMNYTTVDNEGRKQVLNDKYFVPVGTLMGDQFNEKRDISLSYGDDGGYGNAVPDLRR